MRTRMGIHTGEALVGNIGFKDRLSYTAIGDTVNLASRLEGLNKFYDTRILVSGTTAEDLGGAMTLRLVDRVVVKGRSAGIAVYELLSERDPLREAAEFLDAWNAAMSCYDRRLWAEATDRFRRLMALRPTDGPSKVLRDRCEGFMRDPPPADWDGLTVMHEK